MKKICIIIPYFGKWPDWINYFLLSCKYNATIDWLFLTDCEPPAIQANNLIFKKISLQAFNQLASHKLNMNINIKHPYKLCDFKPAYGKIFEDYLKNYDFWGYGDLDLVYGNIRKFINNDILSKFDIISSHSNFVPGHFCLLRNSPIIINLYLNGANIKNIFIKQNYQGFDEKLTLIKTRTDPRMIHLSKKLNIFYHMLIDRIYKIYKLIARNILTSHKTSHNINAKTKKKLKDFTSIVKSNELDNRLKVYFQTIFLDDLMLKKVGRKNWKIVWEKGNLMDAINNKEVVYFHFLISKTLKSFHVRKFTTPIQKVTITRNGITPE